MPVFDRDREIDESAEQIRQQALEIEKQKKRLEQKKRASGPSGQLQNFGGAGILKAARAGNIKGLGKELGKQAVKKAIIAALPYIGTALLIILAVILIIVVILAVIYVGCNPLETPGVLGKIAALGISLFIPSSICEVLDGAATAVVTAINQGSELMCSTPEIIAEQNNDAAFPAQNDPDLKNLMDCVKSKPGLGSLPTYTYEVRDQGEPVNQTFCNYTRGSPPISCGVSNCAHSENSCHYGGSIGKTGSLAVDFDFPGSGGVIGPQILQAAIACSQSLNIPLKRSTCETSTAAAVACSNPGATHVHTSLAKCQQDNGPINSK